ncbi:MAG: SPFH domain-containing protein [Oscillospiraceae bacterium]|nr:SPFH domain-containing protein [Oscillospiraceae bacterium]
MGLIRAGIGAAGGVLADQWREYIYCESLSQEVLVTKGKKRVSGRSSNTRGTDNIISNGSIIAVNEGQCMIIVEQGKVVDLCAESGEFLYDVSTEPTLMYGGFKKENISAVFKNIGKRFTFGGEAPKDQRVYFFNTKEIVGNKYGTVNTVPFRVVDTNIGLDVDISIKCHGEYSYKITNPMLFYANVCGNVTEDYKRETIDGQLRTELLTALQPAFAQISAMGIRYSALPGHTAELADALNDVMSKKWHELRGIDIYSFGVSSVKADEQDEKMIKELQRNAAFRNPNMAAAHLVGAQAEAMQGAAKNEGAGGAFMGFAGMNMANMAGGMNAQSLFQMGAQQPQQASAPPAAGWSCTCGVNGNTGKFCAECGKPRPAADGWACSCGAVNKGNFCAECGKPRPKGAPFYRCDKCGWQPEDPKNPPKFCPECGDIFDENDVQ